MISVSTFKTKITPKLHGASLAKVADVFGKMGEAASTMRMHVYPPSVIRVAPIQNAIYDRVYNYACQDDCDPQSIIDIRPIGERNTNDANVPTQGDKQFDIKKTENTYTVEYVNGVKTLRLSKCLTRRTVLATCDSLIDPVVTSSGDVTDVALDYLTHVSGEAAIGFNLSGLTGQGVIKLDASGAGTDLSQLLNQGALFEWLKFPLASALTNVKLRWGTDASNYWEKTVTAAQDRAFADDAFMLLQFLWSSATKVGSPSESAVKHLEVIINYTPGTARNGVRLDNITAALGSAWETEYYSSCFFSSADGLTRKNTPTLDSDLILLDDDAINPFMYEFMLTLQQELKGKNMAADFAFFQAQLYGRSTPRGTPIGAGLYELYNDKYPCQVPPRQQTYYGFDPLDGYGDAGEGFDDD